VNDRDNIGQTRRELLAKLDFLLHKGYEQAYQLDKSLLSLSAGALLLSVTFIGIQSGTKHCIVLLFAAWACFVASIMAVIFGMRKAQLESHKTVTETANNLERFSQLDETVATIVRARFPVAIDKFVVWLNHIAIWGFVIGAIFLCLFVGINLL
jgi:hypothetical protein